MATKTSRQSNPEESKAKGREKASSVKTASSKKSVSASSEKIEDSAKTVGPKKAKSAEVKTASSTPPKAGKSTMKPEKSGKKSAAQESSKTKETESEGKVRAGAKKEASAKPLETRTSKKVKSTEKKLASSKEGEVTKKAETIQKKSATGETVKKAREGSDTSGDAIDKKGKVDHTSASKKSKLIADEDKKSSIKEGMSEGVSEVEASPDGKEESKSEKSINADAPQTPVSSEAKASESKKRGRKSGKSSTKGAVVESLVPRRRLGRKRPPLLGSVTPGTQSFFTGEARTGESSAATRKLSAAFLKTQRNHLIELRDALIDRVSRVTRDSLGRGDDSEAASAFGQHQADAGSDAYDRDFALNILSKNKDTFYEIEAALKRIDQGEYGICQYSGEIIPQSRLEAVPFARYTVEHQERIEREEAMGVSRHSMTSIFGAEEKETIKTSDDEEED